MQRLRTVTSLDVSAVAGHHAMPAALLFNNYIAIQVVNEQSGLKNNNNLLPVVVVDFARVAVMFELLQYYLSQEKY